MLERLPWREKMTLCVAALARVPNTSIGKTRVAVYAADFQSEGEIAKAEIGRKIAQMGRSHQIVMIAGTYSRAVDLAGRISALMSESPKLGVGFQHLLEAAVQDQKRHLANEYVAGALGMNYEDFINIGKEKLPDDVYREMIFSISRQTLDCTLLVIAFAQMDPTIYRIHESGMVENCEHFAAIGSGYYIAESTLFQREQQEEETIGRTIYNVYESMRLGSYAPGVGKKFEIWIAEWEYDHDSEDEGEDVTDDGMVIRTELMPDYYKVLERHYKRYGPKKVGTIDFQLKMVKKEELAFVVTPVGGKHLRDLKAKEDAVSESKRSVVENEEARAARQSASSKVS
jgi:hypothetical protein